MNRKSVRRRSFLKAASATGLTALIPGTVCRTIASACDTGESLIGFRAPALDEVRVGFIGVGARGPGAVKRLCAIPKTRVTAICDVFGDRVDKSAADVVAAGHPAPAEYSGSEDAFKGLCERPDVNLVYVCTPWEWHVPMALYAMQCGKHVGVEVPMAMTVEDCWRLVHMAEKTRLHCMMLENCCYGSHELFALNLCRKGVLGEIAHAEAGYIHSGLGGYRKADTAKEKFSAWRFKWYQHHVGNLYPTHGLGPVCQCMNINRGDRMTAVVSMSSDPFALQSTVEETFGPESWEAKTARTAKTGDMNTSIIRTQLGKTILLQFATRSPRPYSRHTLLSGTKGTLGDYPLRVALAPNAEKWMSDQALAELQAQYIHPLWDKEGETAKKLGGHGGMDYLMEYRLCHCLLNGLPLDQDVYDGVAWSSLVELTERSVRNGGSAVEVPDFTRGAWQTAEPLGIVGA
ncbi:MAG: Gfo/Idh/MocA family oxidoreductase [Thermoguttaceae bacterium]|jgi:predicted dehydrogenase|nr:Gfo/Idh/MocA family oxidoreductase [Thermoguttaceae bacterium]